MSTHRSGLSAPLPRSLRGSAPGTRHRALRLAAPLLAALLLAPGLAAQQLIGTKGGSTLEGTVLSDNGSMISFETVDGLKMQMSYADLDADTVYRLMAARTPKTDGAANLRLGDQAASAGLFDAARRAYSLAVAADASLQPQVMDKLAKLRLAASQSLLAEAQKESSQGHSDAALRSLTTLLHEFPDEPAAKDGSALLDQIHASMSAARSKAQSAMLSKEIQDALAPMENNYAEMGKKIKQGLQNSQNQGTAIDDFKAAVDIGNSTRGALKSLKGQSSTIQGLGPAIDKLDADVVNQIINADIQLANVYNQRSSYNDANTVVNAGLALQPQNQQLLQLRAQIASNSAESGSTFLGWDGTQRGGGRPTPYRTVR